jgi:Uma2 family endonuclease
MSVLSLQMMERIAIIERDDENPYFEIVDREIEMQPPKTVYASVLASRLAYMLDSVGNASNKGFVVVRAVFELKPNNALWRRPEVAYVAHERWPLARALSYDAVAWDAIPNLAVEIISPDDRVATLFQKISEYFRASVQLVWVVHPKKNLVHIYESPTSVRILTENDVLDGGKVLPQFHLSLHELFAD